MSWIDRRRGIMNKVEMMIKRATLEDKEVDKEKLIANISLVDGVARRTVLEYINMLRAAGKIEEIDDITTKERRKLLIYKIEQPTTQEQENEDISKVFTAQNL